MKQKLLIINKVQFGSLVDAYKWCEYLRDEYDITFICFDLNLQRQSIAGVNVKYVSYQGNIYLRGIRYVLICIWNLFFFKGKIIVEYFAGCAIFKRVFPHKKMILDIRTLSVLFNEDIRNKLDQKILKAIKYYDYITVISDGIREKLNLKGDNVSILPLGSDIISNKNKCFDCLKLLYVGVFSGRYLERTILGLHLFIEKYPGFNIEYHIIGAGCNNELDLFKKLVADYKLDNYVKFYGRIPHEQLTPYFDNCNIGVSFVPITDFYDHQPVTKSFEYILSGLFCIATATYSNKQIINASNGILINDTPEDFAKAVEYITIHKSEIKESDIRFSLQSSTWSNIVNNYLKNIL